jgi:3-isopropylmalate dehydrogenase
MARIAVIAGDGIGPEVTGEALKVLDAAAAHTGLKLSIERFPFGADHFLATGETLPVGMLQKFAAEFDAIFVGALGDPRVPGNEHARDILLGMRFQLDLYVNERPARLAHERLTPLKGKTPAQVDMVVFRENTEGLYCSVGGSFKQGTADEVFVAEEINTRKGVERIVRHAFEWARANGRRRVTLADKSNAIPAHGLWRRVFEEVGSGFADVARDARYIDAIAMDLVRTPESFEVIVTGNLFGDILSDLASMLAGGLGIAPSANRHPGKIAMFEPVHGSAPQLAGKDRANPVAAILSMAMLLEHLGAGEAARAVERAALASLVEGVGTEDVGGSFGTRASGDWIAARCRAAAD